MISEGGMSKEEEGCKMSSTFKHKERKPKKPHYIPRPWGKPYNYKCFQCPFTCMEKSHLYNHMKYSLCKNSLSLLIESDWPYKKSNFLIPEMQLVQESQIVNNAERQEPCDSAGSKSRQVEQKVPRDIANFQDEDEEREEEEDTRQSEKKEALNLPGLQFSPSKRDTNIPMTGVKERKERLGKEGETDFIITNVFSLEGENGNEREDHQVAKASKRLLGNVGGSRSDHWKVFSHSVKNGESETQAGRTSGPNTIPCYPPPMFTDYPEPQGLSLLGINYPLNPSLFSYISPTITSSSGQLPFLASTAQLMQPAHTSQFQAYQNTERSTFLPRFYYPLLFERAYSTAENKVIAGKQVTTTQVPGPLSFISAPKAKTQVETLKTYLQKPTETKINVSMESEDKMSKPMSHTKATREEEVKWTSHTTRDILQYQKLMGGYVGAVTGMNESCLSQKGEEDGAVCAESRTARYLKRKACLLTDGQNTAIEQTSLHMEEGRDFQNSSSCSSPVMSPDGWCERSPISVRHICKRKKDTEITTDNPKLNSDTSILIGDLSRTLEEYGKVEKKLANLASGDSNRQKALGEQLSKIRLELLHIHRTLEKASCSYDGPLDLSIKRPEETCKIESDKTMPGEPLTPPLSECPPKQLVKVELLPPELANCYVRPTKCEADSSVLLCPDGRGVGSRGISSHISIQDDGMGAGSGINENYGRGQQQTCENS